MRNLREKWQHLVHFDVNFAERFHILNTLEISWCCA